MKSFVNGQATLHQNADNITEATPTFFSETGEALLPGGTLLFARKLSLMRKALPQLLSFATSTCQTSSMLALQIVLDVALLL